METSGKVAAILLASGFSKRFGMRNKLLVPFRGKPLARYTLDLAVSLEFSGGIYFITASDDVAVLAADLPDIRVVKNAFPEKGLQESVRLGVEAASGTPQGAGHGTGYFLFFHCDQPFMEAAIVQQILSARSEGCIVEPRCQGRPGNPCLFSGIFRKELLDLAEGETPKIIKSRHPEAVRIIEVTDPRALADIDDEETLEKYNE